MPFSVLCCEIVNFPFFCNFREAYKFRVSAVFKWRGSIWSRFCVFLNWANSAKAASNWSKIPWKSCQKLTSSNLIFLRLLLKFSYWIFYGISRLSGFLTRDFFWDFLGIFKSRSRSPGFWNFRKFALGIFRIFWGFHIPIPIPGISGILGVFRSSPKLKVPIP